MVWGTPPARRHRHLIDMQTSPTMDHPPASAKAFSALVHTRRSVRDFLPTPIPQAVLDAVLADANASPSWSNTQPYRIAIASGAVRDRLKTELTARFDKGMAAQRGGWQSKLKLLITRDGLRDGDFATNFDYPEDLQPRRRATGHGLYELLRIGRNDHSAREAQMRKNFEFFGAPAAIFVFVHSCLREFSVLDAGIFVQTLMLSAHAHGLGTCAQGALATWAGPVRDVFDVPKHYKLICGVSMGYASEHAINDFDPGRGIASELQVKQML
jgi:nitroreductase